MYYFKCGLNYPEEQVIVEVVDIEANYTSLLYNTPSIYTTV